MTKRVVVIASGETERRALPHLLGSLQSDGVAQVDVRIPPKNRQLRAEMAEKLIKAAWFANLAEPIDKFVVIVDTDNADPEPFLQSFEKELRGRLHGIDADVLCTYAQQHLEAWYFADAQSLQAFLGRNLGAVDSSKPDEIQNPKLHLKHLLGNRVYTARVSESIARSLDSDAISQRSPSFNAFLEAVRNGVGSGQPTSS